MDTLTSMDLFVKAVDSGSFSATARAMSLTPSAVSKQISRLEDRLGARLFNRTTRRLAPTEEGRAYYERCRRILADIDEAESAISQLNTEPRGVLRVNMPVVFGPGSLDDRSIRRSDRRGRRVGELKDSMWCRRWAVFSPAIPRYAWKSR